MSAARTDIRFPSGRDECAAWLYRPEGASDRALPLVVLAHGLGAVKEMGLDAYASGFAASGYAALVFDYRHFGASTGTPRQLLDIGRQIEDWNAAIAHARALPGIDPDRIALFGTSFSGGHVISVASRDTRIAAVIAQCPFTDGLASGLQLGILPTIGVTLRALRDAAGALFGAAPVMVPLAGHPGEVALMNKPDVMAGYMALLPPGTTVENKVAARIGLAIAFHFPGRDAARIACPILFCVCDRDSVAPARATVRHARRAPKGEIRRYPFGHFEIYLGAPFDTVFSDQRAFLAPPPPHSGLNAPILLALIPR